MCVHYEPMPSASLTSNTYHDSFIDDSSRKTWIYFMKTKDKVFGRFQKFEALVENQTSRKVKVLRFDSREEYTSKEFNSFCKTGSKSELMSPLLTQQGYGSWPRSPMFLWVLACGSVVYILAKGSYWVLKLKKSKVSFHQWETPSIKCLCFQLSHIY